MTKVNEKIPYIMLGLLFGLVITSGYCWKVSDRLVLLESRQLLQKDELRKLKESQQALAEGMLEIREEITPAALDASLREHFENLLKEDPRQVSGIDGKLPKER